MDGRTYIKRVTEIKPVVKRNRTYKGAAGSGARFFVEPFLRSKQGCCSFAPDYSLQHGLSTVQCCRHRLHLLATAGKFKLWLIGHCTQYYEHFGVFFHINSLWPSGAIWQFRTRPALPRVMASCRTAPSHYLDNCWYIITKISNIHLKAISQGSVITSIKKVWDVITYPYLNFNGATVEI